MSGLAASRTSVTPSPWGYAAFVIALGGVLGAAAVVYSVARGVSHAL